MTAPACHVCGGALREHAGFRRLALVASDCRPAGRGARLAACLGCGVLQKMVDAEYRRGCEAIYSRYELYHQGGGSEQRVFDQATGTSMPRSMLTVRYLASRLGLPGRGRLLDVGCGAGHFLASFREVLPGWSLHGADMNPKYEHAVMALDGVESFSTEPDPGQVYDLVAINHAFEHIPDPGALLDRLRAMLSPGGRLFINVPYHPDNPFDLVIADHCSHFTRQTLAGLLRARGFEPLDLRTDILPKEIVAAASVAAPGVASPPPAHPEDAVEAIIAWLEDTASLHKGADGPLGVFGTAIAGAWLGGTLGDRVDFYLDEDPRRTGGTFLGRPVLAPSEAPAGASVVVAFPQPIAARIAARHAALSLRFLAPRELSIPPEREGC